MTQVPQVKDATQIAKENENATITVAKEQTKAAQDDIITLPSGRRVKYHPVAANLIREVQSRIPEPIVPTFQNPNDKTKTLPNPSSPTYIRELAQVTEQRTQAAMDALLMFGLELVDPLPQEDTWLRKLIVLKTIDASEVENADQFAKELWYKKYIVADVTVIQAISKLAGVTQEDIAKATDSFPRSS